MSCALAIRSLAWSSRNRPLVRGFWRKLERPLYATTGCTAGEGSLCTCWRAAPSLAS